MNKMTPKRSTVNDGTRNEIEAFLLTHFSGLWELVQQIPWLRHHTNRYLLNSAIYKAATRPYPLSTMDSYTSWESLTNRTYSSRHLPPTQQPADLPKPEEVASLFMRRGEIKVCPKSTVLFAYFAQWFTDGFLRTDRSDLSMKTNTSNHEIDLCQLYGLKKWVTDMIRAPQSGLLKSQFIDGEEYPPYLCEDGVKKPEFRELPEIMLDDLPIEEKNQLFAMGGDRANVQIGYVMFNVLFLREHNRIARLLTKEYPDWNDERLFQTARNILIVMLIKIVVEEYINHIAPYYFRFFLDAAAFPNERWHRQNWMAAEFTLLYRWHMLIPSELIIDGQSLPAKTTMWNTRLITSRGLGALFNDASLQSAGRVGVLNSPPFLGDLEMRSVRMGRLLELASYNDYRAACGFPRVTDFDQISGDPLVQDELRSLYGQVDRIEYYAGIFAEDTRPNSVLPPLIGRMVGVDAFSQALTNPLLNPHIFNEQTFSPLGMKLIFETSRLADILKRNIPATSTRFFVSMTRRDWKRA
jgi:prostaglandin-endoperoxide synthase 2